MERGGAQQRWLNVGVAPLGRTTALTTSLRLMGLRLQPNPAWPEVGGH